MKTRKQLNTCLLFFGIGFFFAGQLAAQMTQMNPIYRFKKISIPVDMRIEGSILPKGEYDLEFLKLPISKSYFLRIMKKGKILQLLQGTALPYSKGSKIPTKPVLKMNKESDSKALIVLFESGSGTRIYARVRATFSIPYEED